LPFELFPSGTVFLLRKGREMGWGCEEIRGSGRGWAGMGAIKMNGICGGQGRGDGGTGREVHGRNGREWEGMGTCKQEAKS